MAKIPVSMSRIASELGVSAMAVSLALRGKSGVSDELRERVLIHAKSLGYAPDPVASELMSMLRQRRVHGESQQVIAYINTFFDPGLIKSISTFRNFHEGAVERGRDFGYAVEVFEARGPGMTGARLSQILRARGIRGVLVGPRWRDEPDVEMDWQDFSVVLVGEVIYGPNIYRVCNHHTHSCALALKKLIERGHRRIGLALVDKYESQRAYDFALGVEQVRREMREVNHFVNVWLYRDWDERACADWVRKNRLDAIVSLELEVGFTVEKFNATSKAKPLGYANLDLPPHSHWAGVDQHSREIGSTAMEMLRGLLLGGERGVSPRPKMVLVDGEWRDSAPRPAGTAGVPSSGAAPRR